jgi:hypothetical protein
VPEVHSGVFVLSSGMTLELNYQAGIDAATNGATYKQIAEAMGCARCTLFTLMLNNAPFKARLEQARAIGYASTADEVKTLVTDNPLTDVQMLRLHSDNAKWYLSKMDPARFGDKLDLTVSKAVDLRTAIAEGRSRMRVINAPAIEASNDPFAD